MTQEQALTMLKTGANVFLTGEPGAGKTHTINQYIKYLRDRKVEVAITASTGIAATHIGGMTIHSWSGVGIKSSLSEYDLDIISSKEYVAKRVQKAKVLIIDEVSMLAANMLTMVDAVCRTIKNSDDPFGGLQVVVVGDFFQLPPVTKQRDEKMAFAYEAAPWKEANPLVCYLTEQHRQDDKEFLDVLGAIRRNSFSEDHLVHLEQRRVAEQTVSQNIPKLFSHNVDVDRVNNDILVSLPGETKAFHMASQGPAALVAGLQKGCLSPERLCLKVGAAVMFTKNNPKGNFVNGTLGIVTEFRKGNNLPTVKTREGKLIEVEPMDWSVEENGKVKARLFQLPLRLAWAITVHKSQGISLDEAVMDLRQVFEFGQGYVALSRVRRLTGLHLLGWNEKAFQVHPSVLAQDVFFRASSLEAEKTFSQMKEKELQSLHRNFIKASGGKYVKEKKGTKEKLTSGISYDEMRKDHPNAYRSWSADQDAKLKELFEAGKTVPELMEEFGRKRGGIRARLTKLGFEL